MKRAIILLCLSFNIYAFDIDKGITGSWYDPAFNGEGFNIEILANNRILVYWYTYDRHEPIWLIGTGSYAGNSATVSLLLVQGGDFGVNNNPALVTQESFGALTFTFDSCNSGAVSYQTNFGSGSMEMVRLTQIPTLQCDDIITLNDLAGRYELIDFNIDFDAGFTFNGENVDSFSGFMTISSQGNLVQTVTVNGFPVNVSVNAEVVDNNTFRFESMELPECPYHINFTFNNDTLTTFFALGICGANLSETDVWRKITTSNSVSIKRNIAIESSTNGIFAGALLGHQLIDTK